MRKRMDPGIPARIDTSRPPMSIPSSRALVETTPCIVPLPEALLNRPALLREIPAAVRLDPDAVIVRIEASKGVPQVGGDQLGPDPGPGENYGLNLFPQHHRTDASGFEHHTAPDALNPVYQGRVVENNIFFSRRSAVLVDQLHPGFEKLFGELFRIADGSGTADEHRFGAVKGAYPFKPPEKICHVGAEHSAVHVDLINDHKLEGGDKLDPPRMVGGEFLHEACRGWI